MNTEMESIDQDAVEEVRGGEAATASTPNLSLIDQITIDYMTNRYQKNAVERFFMSGNGPPVAQQTDTRVYEYELYQNRAKELFSRILDEFVDEEGVLSVSRDLQRSFHDFMRVAISYLDSSEEDQDQDREEEEDDGF